MNRLPQDCWADDSNSLYATTNWRSQAVGVTINRETGVVTPIPFVNPSTGVIDDTPVGYGMSCIVLGRCGAEFLLCTSSPTTLPVVQVGGAVEATTGCEDEVLCLTLLLAQPFLFSHADVLRA